MNIRAKTFWAGISIFLSLHSACLAAPWETKVQRRRVDQKIAVMEKAVRRGPFSPNDVSLAKYQAPDWFRDAKFGIFIHWGLFSVPAFANEWYSRNMYQKDSPEYKHQVETYGPLTKFGYKDFIPMLNGKKFDPDHWAELFKEAGARYVVPVAEHHDGFAMYDSSFSRWTAVRMGPKKDVIGLLSKSIRKAGLVFGLSSHRAEHWWFMNGGMKFPSDVQDPRYADFYGPAMPDGSTPNREYLRNWMARTGELMDKYKPQLVYLDWWVGEKAVFKPYLQKLAAFYYDRGAQWGKGVVFNTKNRSLGPGESLLDVERGKRSDIDPQAWQTDTSISWGSWGYLTKDSFKTPEALVQTLIDTVSKNGNFLLNVGPKPDGSIPPEEEKILLAIGQWLRVNGDAIYGTRPWVAYGEGPTQVESGSFNESNKGYQEGDLRFTRKGNSIYLMPLVCPTRPLRVTLLSKKACPDLMITSIRLLGTNEEAHWKRNEDALVLDPPAEAGTFPLAYQVTVSGFAAGGFEAQAEGSSLRVEARLQNYDASDRTIPATLLLDGKEVLSKAVTVAAGSALGMELYYDPPKAGIFEAALDLPGYPRFRAKASVPEIGLSGAWLFQEGDDLKWAKPVFDDSKWQGVRLPSTWNDSSNYTQENCYGWYRKKIFIPAEWKGRDLILPLGKIDDADITYFNGQKIGGMGAFPPAFATAWDKARSYKVPSGLVRWGQDNLIAVRVYNGTGNGGIDDDPLGPVEVRY